MEKETLRSAMVFPRWIDTLSNLISLGIPFT